MQNELRHFARVTPQLETREDGQKVLTGYAAVFHRADDPGTEYTLWAGVVERVMPGAFDRALKEGDDVRALFNHKTDRVLGRSGAGTLRLSVDARGLRYEIDLPDTEDGRAVAELVRRGDITQSSFGFLPDDNGGALWREEGTRDIRELHSVRLYDVGPVTYAAYESTTASIRSDYDGWKDCKSREADIVDVFSTVAKLSA